jgi:hypothetical protein
MKNLSHNYCYYLFGGILFLVSSLTYADEQPLDIAFTKVSSKVEKIAKTAACIIIFAANKERHIYCRYELEKVDNFLRDDDRGINLNDVRLYRSKNLSAFKEKIAKWLKTQFPENNTQITLITEKMLSFLSNTDDVPLFNGKKPQLYLLNNQYGNQSYRKFAYWVHRSIEQQFLNPTPIKAVVQPKPVPLVVKKSTVEQQPKPTIIEAPMPMNLWFLFGISLSLSLSLIFILALFWLLKKSNRHLENQLEQLERNVGDSISLISEKIMSEMRKTSLQHRDDIQTQLDMLRSEQIQSRSFIEETLLKEDQEKAQSFINSTVTELKEAQLELQHTLIAEQEQRETIEAALASANSQLILLSNKYNKEQKQHQEIKETLKYLQAELETANRKNQQAASSIIEYETEKEQLIQQYEDCHATEEKLETALKETLIEIKRLTQNEQSLQLMLFERFRLLKPEDSDFSYWTRAIIEQQGVWRWLQPSLLGELLVCEPIVKAIKEKGFEKDQQILELLHLDNIITHWQVLVTKIYDSNEALWESLRGIDEGDWLNQLLRANDVLNSYFPEEKHLKLLSQHLSNVNHILRSAFVEMGISFISPKIFEPFDNSMKRLYTPDSLLKALVKTQIQERLKTSDEFIVDVERYGFGVDGNPAAAAADVCVVVSRLSEW